MDLKPATKIVYGMDMEELLAMTEGAVEATSYESMMLWSENNRDESPKTWVEHLSGWVPRIGCIDGDEGKPVTLSLFWAEVGDKIILFYDSPSRFVDHTMVREWLEKYCPNARFTDAMNFCNIFR
jgi:hypothetical protein